MVSAPFGTTNEHGYPYFELISCEKNSDSVGNKALVMWPSGDFRATAYKFIAFLYCQQTRLSLI